MRLLALTLISILFLAIQCDEDDGLDIGNNGNNNNNQQEKLPPATQTGEQTFGCKVNGKIWVPEGGGFSNPELHSDYYQDEFFIDANREIDSPNTYTSIAIRIESDFNGEGVYILRDHIINIPSNLANYSDLLKSCEYYTDSFNTGKLTVTHFDSAKRIVSGKFNFTAVIKQGNCELDTVRVTEGRFDIQD